MGDGTGTPGGHTEVGTFALNAGTYLMSVNAVDTPATGTFGNVWFIAQNNNLLQIRGTVRCMTVSGNTAFVVFKTLGKMNHAPRAGRIDPVISHRKPRLGHCTREEGLVCNRGIRCRIAATKDPAAGVSRPE